RDFHVTGVQTCALPISSLGGYYPAVFNIGESDVRGFDAQLRYNQQFGDFQVRLTGNVNWARSQYLKLNESDNIPAWQSLVGKPIESEERRVGKEGRCRW